MYLLNYIRVHKIEALNRVSNYYLIVFLDFISAKLLMARSMGYKETNYLDLFVSENRLIRFILKTIYHVMHIRSITLVTNVDNILFRQKTSGWSG